MPRLAQGIAILVDMIARASTALINELWHRHRRCLEGLPHLHGGWLMTRPIANDEGSKGHSHEKANEHNASNQQ